MLATICVAALAFTCGPVLADPDLWGHTLYGLRAIEQGVLLERSDPFSYTAPGAIWINHEWLSEYAFAWLWRLSGSAGLWMCRNLMAVAVVGIGAWSIYRARASLASATTLLVFSALCLSAFFLFVRPQLFTFALFAWTLFVLRRHWDRPRTKAIWSLPVVIAAWVNLHGGFLAGVGLMAIFAAGWTIRARRNPRDRGDSVQFAAVGIASLLATLVNPYGLQMHSMLWKHLVPEQAVREWMPLWAAWQAPLYYVPFIVIAVALPWSKSWRWIDLVVLAVVGSQAILHIRHVALLAIAVLVLLPGPLSESLARWFADLSARFAHPDRRARRWLAVAGLVTILAALQAPLSWLLWQSGIRPWEIATETSRDVPGVPLGALSAMVNDRIHGNIVTDYAWGQYLLWHLHPQSRVALDGRYRTIYPADLEREFLDFQLLDDNGPSRTPLLDKYNTQIVLLPSSRIACRYMNCRRDFVRVYSDSQAVLYVRDLPQFQNAIARSRMRNQAQAPVWTRFPADPLSTNRTEDSAPVSPATTLSPIASR